GLPAPASGSRSTPATGCGSRARSGVPPTRLAGVARRACTPSHIPTAGRRGPAMVYPPGGPPWQAYRAWVPFKQLLVDEGFAFVDVDFRGSTGYGRDLRQAHLHASGHAQRVA